MTRGPLRIRLPNSPNENNSENLPVLSQEDLIEVFQNARTEEERDHDRCDPLDLQGVLKEMHANSDAELLELGRGIISSYAGHENTFRRCIAAIVFLMRQNNTDESVRYAQDELDRAYRQALTQSQTE